MANQEVRQYAKSKKVTLWQIADEFGVTEPTIVRWLRHELDSDKKQRMIDAIDKIYGERS